jgi:hypothetical protein
MTGVETLQVIHGLVTNMKLVMDGMQLLIISLSMDHCDVGIDGKTSMDGIRKALGMSGKLRIPYQTDYVY